MRNLTEGGRSQNGGCLLAGSHQKRAWGLLGSSSNTGFNMDAGYTSVFHLGKCIEHI